MYDASTGTYQQNNVASSSDEVVRRIVSYFTVLFSLSFFSQRLLAIPRCFQSGPLLTVLSVNYNLSIFPSSTPTSYRSISNHSADSNGVVRTTIKQGVAFLRQCRDVTRAKLITVIGFLRTGRRRSLLGRFFCDQVRQFGLDCMHAKIPRAICLILVRCNG